VSSGLGMSDAERNAPSSHGSGWPERGTLESSFVTSPHEAEAAGATSVEEFAQRSATPVDLRERPGGLDLPTRPAEAARTIIDGGDDVLQMEILRLRDVVAGLECQLGTAHGRIEHLSAGLRRYADLERRLNDEVLRSAALERQLEAVVQSRSWRLAQGVGIPLRKLRARQ
jgi:hypothetical protein